MKSFLLNADQKQQVIDQTEYYIEQANQLLSLNLSSIPIKFDLKGRASGMFVIRQGSICIRYNEMIFSLYYDDALLNTVAHEVAHYVVYSMQGFKRLKPHGIEWKRVMGLFNVSPEVTSSYDVSELPLHRQRQYEYICDCNTHQLSTTRHNRVKRSKAVYTCRKCRQPLKYKS